MLEGILKGLLQWIYGLFLDILSYSANALLGVMSTNLTFFETKVPIVTSLYQIFVAVGWGLLIGNMAFQSMKAMFAGLGFETESPFFLMFRTLIFGTLLIFSRDICDICLSITKNVIDLLGIPKSITITMPTESYFTSGASWLLVIIVGFILGFQLIKLFFEIAERYVIVAVLTLLMPVGLGMGGSKSTKDICSGYMRTYASMLVLMVVNVLFLKLILSALSAMPSGTDVLPWCLLVVGIAKTARKTDSLIARIGMNPAITGDPLGSGRGLMTAAMVARTIMYASGRGSRAKTTTNTTSSTTNNSGSNNYNGAKTNKNGGINIGGSSNFDGPTKNGDTKYAHFSKGDNNNSIYASSGSTRFGSANYNSTQQNENSFSGAGKNRADGGNRINTDRFGQQKQNTAAYAGNKYGNSNQKSGTNYQRQKSGNNVKHNSKSYDKNIFGSKNSAFKHNPNPMRQGNARSSDVGRNGSSDNGRFGSDNKSKFSDKNILITKDDENG